MTRPSLVLLGTLSFSFLAGVYPLGAQQAASSQAEAAAEETSAQDRIEVLSDVTLGGVFVDTDGSKDTFLSHRFLQSGFNVKSALFDFRPDPDFDTFYDVLKVSGFGFGGASPYERADLRMEKRRIYDLDVGYRKYRYFFAFPGFAADLHSDNSAVRSTRVSLRLAPQRRVSGIFGYRRNDAFGTAYTTQDLRLDTFSVSAPRNLSSDEFSGGVEIQSERSTFTFEQSLVRFRDDRPALPNGLLPSGLRGSELDSGRREPEFRISTPVSRAVASLRPADSYSVTGRYMYSGAETDFGSFADFLIRAGANGFPVRQIADAAGTGKKPSHTADVSQTVDITERLRLHHMLHYGTYSLNGLLTTLGVLRFLNNAGDTQVEMEFEEQGGTILDYSLLRNQVDLEYEASDSLSLLGRYRYSDRHVAFGDAPTPPDDQVRISHTGGGGVAWTPNSAVRIRAEIEKENASSAFYRTEALSTLRWKLRAQYRPTTPLSFTADAVFGDSSNDNPGVNYDRGNRRVGAKLTYSPRPGLVATGGYSYFRIRTSTDIVFWALAQRTQGSSLYRFDTHVVHALVMFPLGERIDAKGGYELVKDTGETFPQTLHVPQAGVSLAVADKVRLEVDWKRYSYAERLTALRDYRANVLATGLRLTF